MPGCDVVGRNKPMVWRDDDGWRCDQTVRCRACRSVWFAYLADEGVTWEEAILASRNARPIEEKS